MEMAVHQRRQVVGEHVVVTYNSRQGSDEGVEAGCQAVVDQVGGGGKAIDRLRDPAAKPGGEATEVTAVQDGRPGRVTHGTQEEGREEPGDVGGTGPGWREAGEGVTCLSRPTGAEHPCERERTAKAWGGGGEGACSGREGRD